LSYDKLIESFILLFVAVDPIALIPIFASLTFGLSKIEIRKIYLNATLLSLIILSFFWFFGSALLTLLGISMSSFKIIGGLFLIAIAFEMVLENRQTRRKTNAQNAYEDFSSSSIAIFPLAIPLIAGPGAITVVTLLGEENKANLLDNLVSFTPILLICLLAGLAMWLSSRIANKLPESAIIVLEKLFGILLGALAIEFVASGVRSFLV
jgi:multiple antibiotic resistance protein|tara:strand:- start:2 stop:628 length:627 start_codon:yes stop_codon:yes gene_type:complete